MVKELRVVVKLYNNILKTKREELNFTQKKMAEACGINLNEYSEFELIKKSPVTEDGSWDPAAINIANFCCMEPEELFPDGIKMIVKNHVTLNVDAKELAKMLPDGTDAMALPAKIVDTELKEAVSKAMVNLTPRKRAVLEERFGLNKEHEGKTLREVGEGLCVGPARVRVIEQEALRQLRHPSSKLRVFTTK